MSSSYPRPLPRYRVPRTRSKPIPVVGENGTKFPIVIVVLLALMLFGLIGHVATKGYHCHTVRVGDSLVCQ